MSRDVELKILTEIAANVGRNYRPRKPVEMTGFMAMKGRDYNRELMVVGRSVNGWTRKNWMPEELKSDDKTQEFTNHILKSVSDDDACPMEWVSMTWGKNNTQRPAFWHIIRRQDYSARNSQFWNVIKLLIDDLHLANVDKQSWPSCLVWSNLYKVSPFDGGNPDTKLCYSQIDGCISLLKAELEIYKPRRLLFLTGQRMVAPFLEKLAPRIIAVEGINVQSIGTLELGGNNNCTFVVATHPQGQKYHAWEQEVFKAFESGSK